ncbi:1,2-phenylacetyl-CoA epoxidase subunit PaaD [Polycladospora coralii]|uniref:1,2-phenylacetyl-CoA epoxidase subunit PaaD n=1 Tax=Polycladospora coralii TaxID=2771432 RepID=UPI0034E2DA37
MFQALADVKDPEIPDVSLIEMGMVHRVLVNDHDVTVQLMPTFVGCPALELIKKQTMDRLQQIDKKNRIHVEFVFDPPWTSDRITPDGHQKLKQFGIAPPQKSLQQLPSCPYCNQEDGEILNLFGPTACRAIYYCRGCKQPFEGMKVV